LITFTRCFEIDQLKDEIGGSCSEILVTWKACRIVFNTATGKDKLRASFFFPWRDSPLVGLGLLLIHEDFYVF